MEFIQDTAQRTFTKKRLDHLLKVIQMNMAQQILQVVQIRLAQLGYYLLVPDGLPGVGTSNAVIEFKRNHGLNPRDYMGPITLATLFNSDAKRAPVNENVLVNDPPWLTEARRLLGTKEVIGASNNPIIMNWAKDLDQWYTGDDVPWCGLFMAHCMRAGAPEEPQDFNRLGARAWAAFGEKTQASYGCIGVFWRTDKLNSPNGHVAFIIGEFGDYYIILGGNQSDNVTITKIAKSRLLDCRAPSNWKPIKLPKVSLEGALSVNEA